MAVGPGGLNLIAGMAKSVVVCQPRSGSVAACGYGWVREQTADCLGE